MSAGIEIPVSQMSDEQLVLSQTERVREVAWRTINYASDHITDKSKHQQEKELLVRDCEKKFLSIIEPLRLEKENLVKKYNRISDENKDLQRRCATYEVNIRLVQERNKMIIENLRLKEKDYKKRLRHVKKLSSELSDYRSGRKNPASSIDEETVRKRIEQAKYEISSAKDQKYKELEMRFEEYKTKVELENRSRNENVVTDKNDLEGLLRERDAHTLLAESALKDKRDIELKLASMEAKYKSERKNIDAIEENCNQLRALTEEQRTIIDSLRLELSDGEIERRQLHNEVMELRGNIRVYCRLRPMLGNEVHNDSTKNKSLFESHTVGRGLHLFKPQELIKQPSEQTKHTFTFDRFFRDTESQEEVFKDVSSMVQSALDGYRVCIFAYGQTGSGKTHTMFGSVENPGIIPRSLHQVFNHSKRLEREGWKLTLKASFLEIYNDVVRDLLGTEALDNNEVKGKCVITYDKERKESSVTNLSCIDVASKEEIDRLIEKSMKNRATASTKSNDQSSRSHSVFRLKVEGYNERSEENLVGMLNLIDLAGSERLKKSGAEGARQKEAVEINKSLSSLGNVIAALRAGSSHVPYRNSQLTYFLQDSLGGDCKTLMFLNLSPARHSHGESLSSLRFAEKVNSCTTGVATRNARMSV